MSYKEKKPTSTKKRTTPGYTFMVGKAPSKERYATLPEVRNAYVKGKHSSLKKVVYVSMYGTVKPVGWVWKSQGIFWWASYGSGKLGATPARAISKKGSIEAVEI